MTPKKEIETLKKLISIQTDELVIKALRQRIDELEKGGNHNENLNCNTDL